MRGEAKPSKTALPATLFETAMSSYELIAYESSPAHSVVRLTTAARFELRLEMSARQTNGQRYAADSLYGVASKTKRIATICAPSTRKISAQRKTSTGAVRSQS